MPEYQSRRGRALSLTAILREFCIHWKALLICMIALASLLAAMDYQDRMNSYNIQAAQAGTVQKSDLESRLSEDAKGDVQRALELNNHLQDRVQYQRRNLINQINPYQEQYLELHYTIPSRLSSAALLSQMQSADFRSRLAVALFSQIYTESDSSLVAELIDVHTSTFDELGAFGLTVGIKVTDPFLKEQLISVIDAYMQEHYQLSSESRQETIRVDQDLARVQVEGEAFLLQMTQQFQELRARLSDDQSKLYQMYLENKQDIVITAPEHPQVDPRQAVIGALLGALADLLLLCLYLMFATTLREPEELEEIWDLKLLGKNMQRKAKGWRSLLFSKWAYRKFHGKYADSVLAMEEAAGQISHSCYLRGIRQLQLIGVGSSIDKYNRQLAILLSDMGIQMSIYTAEDGADLEEMCLDNVILSVAGRGASYREIDRVLSDLEAAGVSVLGAFYAEV